MRLVILRSLCDGISTNSFGGNALNCPSHSDPKRHWDIAMSLSSWDHFLMDDPPTPMSHTNIYNGVSIPTSINTNVSLVAIQLPMQLILTLQPTNQRKGSFKIPHSPAPSESFVPFLQKPFGHFFALRHRGPSSLFLRRWREQLSFTQFFGERASKRKIL